MPCPEQTRLFGRAAATIGSVTIPSTGPVQQALAELLAGNARFLSATPDHPNQDAHRRVDDWAALEPLLEQALSP